jgi:FkbM family methyltransferase
MPSSSANARRAIKRVFSAIGLDVRRATTGAPRMTMAGFLEHCKRVGFRPGTIFDVGVATGTCEIYDAFPAAALVLVEPLPEFEPVLRELARVYGAEYVLAAASDSSGAAMLNVHVGKLDSSSMMREIEGKQVDGVPREVRTITLDELAAGRSFPKPYLLKIDVQGAELKVLDGARRVLEDCELVILEVSLFGNFIGGPQFYEVVQYMKERGFVVYDLFGPFYRPLDMALAQVDIAFVEEAGFFRQSHCVATPEQRAAWRHEDITEAVAGLRQRGENKR